MLHRERRRGISGKGKSEMDAKRKDRKPLRSFFFCCFLCTQYTVGLKLGRHKKVINISEEEIMCEHKSIMETNRVSVR